MVNLVAAASEKLTIVSEFPHVIEERLGLRIPLSDGTVLAARAWLPEDAHKHPVPAVVEYIPYRQRDFTAPRDAVMHPYFAGHGYAAVRVDIRGSGDSEGVPLDEYVSLEQDDGLDVLAWIAAQPWCSGETGMIGISWGGFSALQVAARRPPSLKAIITVCSTDDRYHDDVHYMGGSLLSNNTTWGSCMFGYMGRPPDPQVVGEGWRDMWRQRIEAAPTTLMTWLAHPFRDDYWKHGSVCEDYRAIDCAVYAVGGWTDGYTNAIPRLLGGLPGPRRGLIGPWAHGYPHIGVPGPNIGFLQDAVRWWDRWLKHVDNGIDQEPMLWCWMQQPRQPTAYTETIDGRWVSERLWPATQYQPQRLTLNVDGLAGDAGVVRDLVLMSPLITGTTGGEWTPHGVGPELSTDQRLDDAYSLVFDSEPLLEALEILGAPALTVKISSDKPVASLAARLNVVFADGRSSRVTYGVLNLCHRDSHESPAALEPGKTYTVVLKLNDVAQHFPAGARVRLALSSALWPLLWPAPEQATLRIRAGESWLWLPVRSVPVGDSNLDPFAPAEIPKPKTMRWLREVSRQRQVECDVASGRTSVTFIKDDGAYYLDDVDMEVDAYGTERHSIIEGDPLSAEQTIAWAFEHSRGNWRARVESDVSITCSATHLHVTMGYRAFDGDELFAERREHKDLPRHFI